MNILYQTFFWTTPPPFNLIGLFFEISLPQPHLPLHPHPLEPPAYARGSFSNSTDIH